MSVAKLWSHVLIYAGHDQTPVYFNCVYWVRILKKSKGLLNIKNLAYFSIINLSRDFPG